MLKWNSILAVLVGVSLSGVKILLNEDLWWPFALTEHVAAALLLLGAYMGLKHNLKTGLIAGWAFTAGITWSTLIHHLERIGSLFAATPIEWALAVVLATSFAAFLSLIVPARNSCQAHSSASLPLVFVLCLFWYSYTPSVNAASETGLATIERSLIGEWVTPGYGSVVQISTCKDDEQKNTLCGKIVWLWDEADSKGEVVRDEKNPDRTLREKPLVGLTILLGLEANGDDAEKVKGKIYNPEDGRTYSATFKPLTDNTILLKGCALSIFCDKQVWRRVQSVPMVACNQGREVPSGLWGCSTMSSRKEES